MQKSVYIRNLILFVFWIGTSFSVSTKAMQPDSTAFGWVVPVNFARPLVSEIESSLIRVAEGYGRTHPEYMLYDARKNYALFLNVNLGVRLPIWSKKLRNDWYMGIDIPIYFHLWLDLKSISAPVLNTDYRFAVGQVKFLKKFYDKRIKNLSIRVAPLCHESTHIGDELSLRRAEAGIPIRRVNVTYEYGEVAVCLNDPNGTRETNHAYKFGLMIRNPFANSWFRIYPEESDTVYNTEMKNVAEAYFQYEWQRANGWGTRSNILNVLSLEVRSRAQYAFPTLSFNEDNDSFILHEQKNQYAVCTNLFWGWKFYPKQNWFTNSFGLYLNAYYGIVPWGQFRNIPHYSYLGFSVVVDQ